MNKLLRKLGFKPNLSGYVYIMEAVNILKKSKKRIRIMDVYEKIGKNHKMTENSIERAIRYSINIAYQDETLKKFYNKKPSSSLLLKDIIFNLDMFKEVI